MDVVTLDRVRTEYATVNGVLEPARLEEFDRFIMSVRYEAYDRAVEDCLDIGGDLYYENITPDNPYEEGVS